MAAMLHDNLENGRREPGELVHDTHCGIPPVNNRCSFDSWCVLKAVGDELIGRAPKRGQKLSHLSFIKSSGLSHEDFTGLEHCQTVVSIVTESLTRVSGKDLLIRCFGLKNKAGIVTALLAMDFVGILHAKERNLAKFVDGVLVLTKRELDKNSTAMELFVLLVSFGRFLRW